MGRSRMQMIISVHGNFGDMRADLLRIRKRLNFHQVVLEGINAMQHAQRTLAPIGHTGPGPHGRIPRSILPARIYRRPDGSAWAESKTNYGPAIFTSEGTGQYGPRKRPYFVARPNDEDNTRGYMHPGMRGTNWWDAGAQMGEPVALAAFERKVKFALGVR